MQKLTTTFIATTLLMAGSAYAFNQGDFIGTSEEEIRTALTEAGYTVEEIEVDGDEIEVEATLNGEEFEFEIASADGSISEIETEADEDNDEDKK